MDRYHARTADGLWSVFDRLDGDTLPIRESGVSESGVAALADLLNCLHAQAAWKAEARLWPAPVPA